MSQTAEAAPDLVAGRECGFCTICCYALPIDTQGMQKASGAVCVHCTGKGCGIYERRPSNCRSYNCGWRLLPQLPDDWRPDRSGVLVLPQNQNIPESYEMREGLELMLLAGEAAITRPGFAEVVAVFVKSRVPLFFSVPGPVGTVAARAFVGDALVPAVESRNHTQLVAEMLKLFRAIQDLGFQPDVFAHASG